MNLLSSQYIDKTYKTAILIVISVLTLYFAGNIIFPILFAFFVSLALLTPCRWLERIGIPRFLSASILILVLTSLVILLMTFISYQGYHLIDDLNQSAQTKRLDVAENVGLWFAENMGGELPDKGEAYNMMSKKLMSTSGYVLETSFSMIKSTLVFLSLVPIYALLFLIYRGRIRMFLEDSYRKRRQKEGHAIIEEISDMVQSYLVGLVFVIVIVCILYSVGLWALGVPYALMLGVMTAILIIIPYVGAIIGAVLPALVALITLDPWWYSLVVLGLYLVVQLLEGNVLTPMIVGRNVNLNALVIILGMVVLGSIGGVLAMVIAVPLIATLKIILAHSDRFKQVALLMEQNTEK